MVYLEPASLGWEALCDSWLLTRGNFWRLFGGSSLLRASYERIAGLVPPEQVNVITNQSFAPLVAEELPSMLPQNIFGEPVGRDTANAVGLAAALLMKRDPDAVMGVFTADHMITPLDRFHRVIEQAYQVAETQDGVLVTIGIRPSRADTNIGYIHRGERIADDVYAVEKFVEKPGVGAAMKYLASGEYYWNSGMFAWRAATILAQLKKQLPQSYNAIMEIAAAWGTPNQQKTIDALYPTLMRISIDFAVLERAHSLMVETQCSFWAALAATSTGNVYRACGFIGCQCKAVGDARERFPCSLAQGSAIDQSRLCEP